MAGLYFELVFLFKIYLWMYFRWIACLCLHFIDLIREGYSTRLNWAETIKVGPRGQWWSLWWRWRGGWGWRRQWWRWRFGRWWWWQRYSTQLGRNYQGRSSPPFTRLPTKHTALPMHCLEQTPIPMAMLICINIQGRLAFPTSLSDPGSAPIN